MSCIFIPTKIINETDERRKHNQIALKLRVGLDIANAANKEFYFIFLDIAPISEILYYEKKKMNARRFLYYRNHPKNLKKTLSGIPIQDYAKISQNMGWLTWASLFKTILRVS